MVAIEVPVVFNNALSALVLSLRPMLNQNPGAAEAAREALLAFLTPVRLTNPIALLHEQCTPWGPGFPTSLPYALLSMESPHFVTLLRLVRDSNTPQQLQSFLNHVLPESATHATLREVLSGKKQAFKDSVLAIVPGLFQALQLNNPNGFFANPIVYHPGMGSAFQ